MCIQKNLLKDIASFCQLNGLDRDKFINDILKKAFMIEKYGDRPFNQQPKPKVLKEQAKASTSYSFSVEKVEVEKADAAYAPSKDEIVAPQLENPSTEETVIKKDDVSIKKKVTKKRKLS